MPTASTDIAALHTTDGGAHRLNLHLTTDRVAAGVLLLTGVLVGLVGLSTMGVEIPLVRQLLGVLFLTLVPGGLALRLLGVDPDDPVEFVLYTVVSSLSLVMVYGVTVNFALHAVGVANPISEVPLVLSMAAGVIALTAVYRAQTDDDYRLSVVLDEVVQPQWLALALLPFLAIYGALLLTRFDVNVLLLVLYAAIGVLPILVVFGKVPKRAYPAVVWAVAVSLLLQNALTGNYLAWGDQPKEAELALHVIQMGFWDPVNAPAFGNKYAMLRIVLLHPVYALVSDLELVWVFKVVHPLIFSLTPVALYQAYKRFVDGETAFLSAYLYVSLFSFFIVLSRNTRTATALLFLAMLALVVADGSLPDWQRQTFAILFSLSVVVSHYGVSYMVLFALPVIFVLTTLLGRIFEAGSDVRRALSPSFIGLYLTGTMGWYIYASPDSKSFGTLVGFLNSFVTRLQSEFLSPSASATTRIIANDWHSTTLRVLKFYNVGIGGFIGLGLLAVLWRRYRGRGDIDVTNEYLAFAGVFLAVFGVTFLPVERFNTARTFPTSLLFFAPFFVLGLREVFQLSRRVLPKEIPTDQVRVVAAVILVGYFLLNVGFVSATVTHEYSPNALVEKPRITADGHLREIEYFYKQYPTVQGASASEWLVTHASVNATVYQSGWPGGMRQPMRYEKQYPDREPVTVEREPIPAETAVDTGYVYLAPFSHDGGVKFPAGHFEFSVVPTSEVSEKWDHKDRVYDNGGSVVYY